MQYVSVSTIKRLLRRVRWHWVPAAIVLVAMVWTRDGPPVAVLAVLGGFALGFYGERQARRRRERSRPPG